LIRIFALGDAFVSSTWTPDWSRTRTHPSHSSSATANVLTEAKRPERQEIEDAEQAEV
jgi:hypothetical protein